jgi:hypothetical protein
MKSTVANVSGADGLVEVSNVRFISSLLFTFAKEYLVFRGFTQSFRAFQNEKNTDRTKSFEASRIVEASFSYIHNFDIESFISLWDFLSQRFFLHLDQEYTHLADQIKALVQILRFCFHFFRFLICFPSLSDMLKYYLVQAKKKRPSKIGEFFAAYSHEILSESDQVVNLRSWYSLPYIQDPEKDPDFGVYFSPRWADILRLSLHNLLSIVLKTAPTPKLLLLERWFSSEAQESLRAQVKSSITRIDELQASLKERNERIEHLHVALRNIVLYLNKKSKDFSLDSSKEEPESEDSMKRQKKVVNFIKYISSHLCKVVL